ncbi:UDP-N-acetylmuramoyl-L-alanyl-D-glutamate--2,6-diaminopimelate ligase [Labrys wisconsinensis]|uniref:UDP-N-acetylmuramoyl-L-alanyl-D-glutamate--2,6-diaminopimelate ligase n=1 Tax=Labrys wisconsinensis TaxID=425677 RepID=A0ABU0JF27_9HYPH|nr:UDP-N-acetylmuramoyl-L-alanyl-D-glutamate--2,6-diaminopimelate ligase [Labrys wisconsinensis]MDQ0472879.1 UDP-N-acetylmuramoyl-L-alanyl-D-glutamate--2,6-diaminopimelate ligase [Labrys wisconsinensis]
MSPRPLAALLPADAVLDPRFAAMPIVGITVDSRAAQPGWLFCAMPGIKADGMDFAAQAVANGAVAVLGERAAPLPEGIAFAGVPNARKALSHVAAAFHPRQPATIAAVTGTSGKTSVAAFVRQIWAALGLPAASIGTVGLVAPWGETYGSLTTPDPVALHALLDEVAGRGVTHLAMEASSHGLDQHRLDGVRLAAGGFTNLSRDHLDYHPTLEAYRDAKLRLFSELLPPGAAAAIETDHPEAQAFVDAAAARGLNVLTVGEKGSGIKLLSIDVQGFSQGLRLEHRGAVHAVRLPLAGRFQVENALVAAGLCIGCGAEPAAVFAALERLEGAKGRLERVGAVNGAPVFVDYAHKPDALEKALEALRPFVRDRLVVVFGCGGDRDPGKRPMMGAIAARLADRVIVTDDNPRSEDPAAIRAAALAAAPGAIEIGDRGEAIRTAVAELRPGDALLIAGKGHEPGQIVGRTVLPFSDHEVARAAISAAGTRSPQATGDEPHFLPADTLNRDQL